MAVECPADEAAQKRATQEVGGPLFKPGLGVRLRGGVRNTAFDAQTALLRRPSVDELHGARRAEGGDVHGDEGELAWLVHMRRRESLRNETDVVVNALEAESERLMVCEVHVPGGVVLRRVLEQVRRPLLGDDLDDVDVRVEQQSELGEPGDGVPVALAVAGVLVPPQAVAQHGLGRGVQWLREVQPAAPVLLAALALGLQMHAEECRKAAQR